MMSEEKKVALEAVKEIVDLMMDEIHQAKKVELHETECLFCGYRGTEWALVGGWYCCPKCGAN